MEETSNRQDSDAELITRVAQGDVVALDTLYVRYARPVFSLAVRVLGDAAAAEAVTQEVFERVWRHARRVDPARGQGGTWLVTMAHHVAIDTLRQRQRRPVPMYGAVADQALHLRPSPSLSSDDATVRTSAAEQIRRAVRSLPPLQRHAIELAYFGGVRPVDIAARLGVPLDTVMSQMRRGMVRVRAALDGMGVAGDAEAAGHGPAHAGSACVPRPPGLQPPGNADTEPAP
jgi:RNA polymerase sigma-70 factor (ECF subfamily)